MKESASRDFGTDCDTASVPEQSGIRSPIVEARNRMPELDTLRGVAIFGVLILHSSFTSRFSEQTLAIQALLARLFDWAVLAFFFSSGFLYTRSLSFPVTLKKRCMSLLIPFLLYNVFYNLCFAGAEAMHWLPAEESVSTSIPLISGLFRSPAFQLYFLPYLFLVSVGICGLDKLYRRHHEWVYRVLLLSTLGFYMWHGYPEVSHGPAMVKLPLYLAAFLVGVMGRPVLERESVNPWLFATTLGILLCILPLMRLPVISLAVPPFMVGLAKAIPKMANSKLLLSMGMMSGSIYVWHTPLVLPALTRLLAGIGVPSLFVFFGSLALTLAACMFLRSGLDWFFGQLLKKPTPRYITL
jgi:hypothetical protein